MTFLINQYGIRMIDDGNAPKTVSSDNSVSHLKNVSRVD